MIIRCPHCDHTRTINTDKIPPSAELATCPRCKNRFRFRALEKADAPVFDSPKEQDQQSGRNYRDPARENQAKQRQAAPRQTPVSARQRKEQGPIPAAVREEQPPAPQNPQPPAATPSAQAHSPFAVPEVQRPQSAFREAAEKAGTDIWDAVDALHQRWESQMDQHVTEVVTPRPGAAGPARGTASPPDRDAPMSGMGAAIAGGDTPRTAPAGNRTQDRAAFPAMSDLYDSVAAEEGIPARQDPLPPPPGIAPRTLVNYTEQGYSPEDIVEEDIKILQHSHSEKRPMRDLGKLKEFLESRTAPPPETETLEPEERVQEPPQDYYESHLEQEGEESQVPWENQEEYGGWFKALVTTVYFVMFRGPSFFSNLGRAGAPLSHCYLFFLILGYVAIIGSVLWAEIAMLLIQDAAPLVDNLLTLPILLVIAPLALGLMQLFVTGCIRLQLKILAPDRADFATSYRITAYSVAPFVLCLVPFVGPSIGAAWFAFALVTGCRYALKLSWGASVAITIPPAGLLIGGLCWFFLM